MADRLSPEEVLAGFADLDLDRARRRGYPEAVYCPGKTPEQVGLIAAALREHGAATLFTRATAAHAAAILAELPDAAHAAECGLLAWPPEPPDPVGGRVVVVAAGTADHPVAREALLTARHLGRPAELVMDVGVAGLHRVLGRLDVLRAARVIVVVAGMDGALAGGGGRAGRGAGGGRADVDRVRRVVRGSRAPAHDAQQLRARGGGGQHRQRLRRGAPGRSDRGAVLTR